MRGVGGHGGRCCSNRQIRIDVRVVSASKAGSNIKWNSPTFQFGPHESAEAWRVLGSLELLRPTRLRRIAEAPL